MSERVFDAEEFRRLGHTVIDRLADYLADVRTRGAGPVLPKASPEQVLALFKERPRDLPHLIDRVIATTTHFHHPRNVGHQVAPALPEAALCDLVASLLNNSSAVFETSPAGAAIERQLLEEVAEVMGFGPEASGLIVSGGSIGNLTALLAARQAKVSGDVGRDGQTVPLAVLVSEQAHYCVSRAAQIMGIGEAGVYRVPVDERFRMRADLLAATMQRAVADGRKPFVVVASAGTTATGSIDPLGQVADFAAQHGLWLHVDGAHGAALAFHPKLRSRIEGLERADSVVWDAHKMALVPALVSLVLFKDGDHPYRTFRQQAQYLFTGGGALRERWFDAGQRTIECTKPMAALKLYAVLALRGREWVGNYMAEACELASRFAERLQASPDFTLAVKPECNIVCFRPQGASDAAVDALRTKINQQGQFYLVRTALNDQVFLRCTLINPLTTDADLDALLDALRANHSEG